MASNQLPAGVHSFLTSDEGSVEYANSLNVISGQFEAGQLTVLDLVKALAEVLISTDDATRTRGALLLAEVVGSVPGSVDSAQDMHHLAVFFASRISDWPSLRPALKGCLSLLQQRDELRPRCAPADAIEIMRALLDVNVRSLTVADRQLCLQLLLTLIEGYGSDLVGASLSLLEGAAAALDGERDPRCLLAGFSAIQSLATLYAQSGDAPAKELQEHAEEVVDVLGCYFPIVYTPPAQAKGKVTREELVSGVEQALSAAPAFAQYVLPMLLEKLSSSLRQAQEDALSALAACTRGYGAAAMEQYLPKIWETLHNVLTATVEPDLASEDKIKAKELAGKAQVCLRECARSLTAEGSMQLVDLVLDDGIMCDLLDDVADAGQRGGFAGASRRSQAALPVLAAVAGSSPLGSSTVCQRLLVSLIRLTESAQSNVDVLMLQLQILAKLMTFSRTSSPLSEGDQQHALHLLLSHACAASMPPASTSGGNTASSQDLQAQLKHVGGSDQEAVSSVGIYFYADSQHSPLLTTLSDENLLAEDPISAESVVLELFDGIAALSKEKKSVSGAALHDAATLAQVAAWVCSGTKDANIASAACRTVMTAAASLPTRPHAEIAQEIAPATAALAVLPPGFAAEEQQLQVLRALLNLALGLQDDFAASAAAVAAASVVNKAPKDEVDRAVGMALDDILLPQLEGKGTGCKRALACLGQLSKALVMRGHARFQDLLEAALKLSDELAAAQPMPMEVSPPLGNHTSTYATAADAAQVFGSLVEVYESLLLNRSSRIFSKGRVLWQQRAFSVAADLLIQKFEAAMRNGGAAPSRGTIYCLERLLSVAGRDAPAAMRAGYDRVLPAALTSLVALSGFGDVSDDDVMEALLQQMQQALGTPQGQAVLEGELDRLVPLCAERMLGAAHTEHRAHAVAALESLAAYPYRLLHPFRGQVLAALAKAVDDRKRAVRAAAVRCRRKWGA
ncbi:hypothetical protein WJX75_005534 [Coccomyxa subellipsoidea]|uniref:MMS19 nucleotide excision repair protein n=1 Tax=Coccomyxa subellipsoidea TaxID=248742 RepID=A0ABR2YZ10_9CHLO